MKTNTNCITVYSQNLYSILLVNCIALMADSKKELKLMLNRKKSTYVKQKSLLRAKPTNVSQPALKL